MKLFMFYRYCSKECAPILLRAAVKDRHKDALAGSETRDSIRVRKASGNKKRHFALSHGYSPKAELPSSTLSLDRQKEDGLPLLDSKRGTPRGLQIPHTHYWCYPTRAPRTSASGMVYGGPASLDVKNSGGGGGSGLTKIHS